LEQQYNLIHNMSKLIEKQPEDLFDKYSPSFLKEATNLRELQEKFREACMAISKLRIQFSDEDIDLRLRKLTREFVSLKAEFEKAKIAHESVDFARLRLGIPPKPQDLVQIVELEPEPISLVDVVELDPEEIKRKALADIVRSAREELTRKANLN
jgi:hypothetical protein